MVIYYLFDKNIIKLIDVMKNTSNTWSVRAEQMLR